MLSGVSKTAILTLRARAEEHGRSDRVLVDPLAAEWIDRIDWPPELNCWWSSARDHSGIAFRADDIDRLTARFLAADSSYSVVELGCGLSTRRDRLSGHSFGSWIEVDLPEVIEVRRSLGAAGEQIAASVLDRSWMDRLPGRPSGHLFIAEGLLYYLRRADVDALIGELRRRFSGSAIIFDLVGANEYPTLLDNTAAAGVPIGWKLDDFSEVLAQFGLSTIDGLEPDRLMDEALKRYWHRLTPQEQGAMYYMMSSEVLRRGRSGTVCGRL
jgi:O-methyltransferase involved in polyketide biosynthesis